MNVAIGDKKTYDDWGLKLESLAVGMPEAKINQIDIPGADGAVDLTEAMGPVRYGNRELEMVFGVTAPPGKWQSLTSSIANYLHGRRLKVIFDTDPGYYYIGRLSLSSDKSDYLINKVTITGDMEPYKYEMLSGLEDWIWDWLDFQNGIIREYGDMKVEGSLRVVIPGTRREIVPTIISDSAMQVEWKGARYEVPAGESKIYAISIAEGENVLTFYGHGTVGIDYRGGML